MNIVEIASDTADLSILTSAVTQAGLAGALSGGEFTVFAPTDAAFNGLGASLDVITDSERAALLTKVLQYHVVEGRFEASDLQGRTTLTTLTGQTLRIDTSDGVMINNAMVQTANIEASNGIVHLIDGVMLETLDVVERAIITPELSAFIDVASDGQLIDTLQEAGEITIFAPTNAAFSRVDQFSLSLLRQPSNRSDLQRILRVHLVPQLLFAEDLSAGDRLETLQVGQNLTVGSALNGATLVNNTRISATNIEVANGVIHLIDEVLFPVN